MGWFMSATIWTQCAENSEARPLRLVAHRVVESQSINATRKLVDSDDEQRLLEELIDGAKPPLKAPEFTKLHYLQFTPFRYPPLAHGSRFGTRAERSLWYGSLSLSTAMAEVAFYRLQFLQGTTANLDPVNAELTGFCTDIETEQGIDLTARPFDAFRHLIASRTSYADSQPLGRDMRNADIHAFLFPSARDPNGGTNVGLFHPAFANKQPHSETRFRCYATRNRVEFSENARLKTRHERIHLAFERSAFEVDHLLPNLGA